MDPEGDERAVPPEIDAPDFAAITKGVDVVVPVSVTDRGGVEVVHADITTWVTPAI